MKLRAFTMAEMLVAMAIIGIVSALTIPVLKQDYQKKMYVAKLQKAIHVLNEGFKTMRVEEGVRFLSRTNMTDCADDIYADDLTDDERICITSHMKKYFNIIKHAKQDSGSEYYDESKMRNFAGSGNIGSHHRVFIENYSFYANDNILYAPFVRDIEIYVDINGKNAPNQMGRDIFVLEVNDLGEVIPLCSGGDWKNNPNKPNCKCDNTHTGIGKGCAARIKEEGWKMNY